MISVIVPCYNAEKTVERCVRSLVNQTYLPSEIILIDDGSTDNTREVLGNLLAEFGDGILKVVHQVNQGVSKTRNRGIFLAQGQYISFVDADDFVEAYFFEALISPFLSKASLSLSVIGVEKSEYLGKKKIVKQQIIDRDAYFLRVFEDADVKGYPCNKLYRKEILESHQIYFDSQLTLLEDLEFNLRYAQYVESVSISNKKAYHYIIEGNSSTMTSGWTVKKMGILDSFDKMEGLSYLNDSQRDAVRIEKIRMLIWLAGQLYRTGQQHEIEYYKSNIFLELSKHKKLFLLKGMYTGWKYYLSYLLFCIFPDSLGFLSRIKK